MLDFTYVYRVNSTYRANFRDKIFNAGKNNQRFWFDTKEFPEFNNVKTGDSIALNGVCTTVVSLSYNTFTVNLMNESLKRSSLQYLERKNPVNLELAMPADGRFNGHIVQGHVDTVGKNPKI